MGVVVGTLDDLATRGLDVAGGGVDVSGLDPHDDLAGQRVVDVGGQRERDGPSVEPCEVGPVAELPTPPSNSVMSAARDGPRRAQVDTFDPLCPVAGLAGVWLVSVGAIGLARRTAQQA